jgi:transcription elongation factor Elf1
MSVYIDKKYISLLAPKLPLFKQRGEFLWNFRCPVCGDSNKDKTKARGYIYKKKENFFFMCHNCHTSTTFKKFLKTEDPMLYRDYMMESFVQSNTETKVDATEFVTKPVFKPLYHVPSSDTLFHSGAARIKTFPPEFYARKYLEDRKVSLIDMWYASDFAEFVKNLYPHYEKTLYKEPRIVIPFCDRDGNLLGVQGRSIGPSKIKYITVKEDENSPKIFGWNKIDTSKNVYVVEGPIDSLFLDNCIATMDAALYNAVHIVGFDKSYTFVYDNEPRNKQIVSNMRKTIELGHKVCIWPDTIKEKDINEMVLAGTSTAAIQHIIDSNTYEGLLATMRMNQWSKL